MDQIGTDDKDEDFVDEKNNVNLKDDTDIETESVVGKVVIGGSWKLYCSRALTAWGDRLWSYGLGLLLFKIFPENFSVVAWNGLVDCVANIIFGASIGNFIDSRERLTAAKTFLIIQNVSVAFNCGILATYLNWRDEAAENFGSWVTPVMAAVSIGLGLVSNLASAGSKIVVEKDWIVVIAGDDEDKLASLNSIYRTIDLVCLTAAPSLAGILFTYSSSDTYNSYVITAIVIGAWNVCSVIFEYLLLVSIYRQFPALAKKPTLPLESTEGVNSGLLEKLTGSYRGWSYYFSHKVRNAGLGLAFLFMTVLGFDQITWAFAIMQCVTEAVLGILVAVSALVGIAGSLVFPLLRKLIGVERAGMIGMGALVASLSLCVVSIWLPGSPFDPNFIRTNTTDLNEEGSGVDEIDLTVETCAVGANDKTSVTILLIGIILARFGLWIADLSVTQILQENVTERKRGVVGGVQNSLNSSFNLLKFCLVLIMPDQHMFGILIILSFAFICFGAVSLSSYSYREGKCSCVSKTEYSAANREEPTSSV